MKASKIMTITAAAIAIGGAVPTAVLLAGGTEPAPQTATVLPYSPQIEYTVPSGTVPVHRTETAYTLPESLTTAAVPTESVQTTVTTVAVAQPTVTKLTLQQTVIKPVWQTVQTAQTVETVTQTIPQAAAQPAAQPDVRPAPVPETGQTAEPVQAPAPQPLQAAFAEFRGKMYGTSNTELDFTGMKLTEADLPELKSFAAQMPNLKKLILCDCGLSNETLANLQNELGIRVVWRVKLGTKWSLRTDATAFSVLIMDYSHKRMTSDDLEVLKYCPDLLALDLGHQAITDLSRIADYLPDLRVLILADNQISDLSPLSKLTHLHYLELFVNRVSDLSPLAGLKELVDVNISYNPIGDVTPLLHSPMMQRVWLESTWAGEAGANLLKQTYPEAKVVHIGEGSVDQGWRWGHPRYEQMMQMWYNDFYGNEFSRFDDLAVSLGLRG